MWSHKRTEVSFDLILLWHHYMETKTTTDAGNDVFLVSSRLFLAKQWYGVFVCAFLCESDRYFIKPSQADRINVGSKLN